MALPDLTTSLIFAVICLTISVGLVQLSGFVPAADVRSLASNPTVTILLIGGICLTIGLVTIALTLAVTDMGWAPAVIIGGITFLVAPFLVEPLPARIKDSASGLVIFIAAATVALGLGIFATWGL